MPNQSELPSIRLAQLADLNSIVDFHVKIWREAYSDHVSKAVFLKLDHDHRRPVWAEYLGNPASGQQTHIATIGTNIVGLLNFGPSKDPTLNGSGEIKHLYVDSKRARAGIGSKLMHLAFSELYDAGHDHAMLSVLKQNLAAQAFYASIHGERVGSYVDPGPVWKSEGYLYRWELPQSGGRPTASRN